MYAIIRAGGKQYKVQAGDTVRVDSIAKKLGDEFDLTEVLLVGGEKTFIGQPVLANARVTVVVTQQAKNPKVVIFKKKRRQGYRRMTGHRQMFTELFVKSITNPDGQKAAADNQPTIVDQMKNKERKAKYAAAQAEAGASKPKAKVAAKKVTKKKTAAKKVAKKATGGKKTVKKAATKTTKKKAKTSK